MVGKMVGELAGLMAFARVGYSVATMEVNSVERTAGLWENLWVEQMVVSSDSRMVAWKAAQMEVGKVDYSVDDSVGQKDDKSVDQMDDY